MAILIFNRQSIHSTNHINYPIFERKLTDQNTVFCQVSSKLGKNFLRWSIKESHIDRQTQTQTDTYMAMKVIPVLNAKFLGHVTVMSLKIRPFYHNIFYYSKQDKKIPSNNSFFIFIIIIIYLGIFFKSIPFSRGEKDCFQNL